MWLGSSGAALEAPRSDHWCVEEVGLPKVHVQVPIFQVSGGVAETRRVCLDL